MLNYCDNLLYFVLKVASNIDNTLIKLRKKIIMIMLQIQKLIKKNDNNYPKTTSI